MFTLLGLAVLLLLWERWRTRPSDPSPLAGMAATLWVMVNTHQMWIVGLVLVAGFAVHVGLTRALAGRGWVDESDAELPLRPLLLTFVGGLLAAALSPLGVGAWVAPWALVTTMLALGSDGSVAAESQELEPIWTDPIGGPITALLLLVVVVAGWRARGRWSVLELGVLLMGLGMVGAALRGIPFFALAAAAVAVRWSAKAEEPLVPEGSLVPGLFASLTLFLATVLLVTLSLPREHAALVRQQGVGRSVGEWPEASTAFLRTTPPPGEMMNIGWVAANYLNFEVYPVRRVFVDGRWEAYPKAFLTQTMAAERDQAVLDSLIAEWEPGFVVVEMRDPDQLDRLATLVERGWPLVFVDSILAVAVRPHDGSQAYVGRWAMAPASLDLPDWLPEHPVLHAQQQIRLASLLRRLGESDRAGALWAEASAHGDHPAVARDLALHEE